VGVTRTQPPIQFGGGNSGAGGGSGGPMYAPLSVAAGTTAPRYAQIDPNEGATEV
jgi:hypothetical protein